MRKIDCLQLSKTPSHALRHEPWLYELELDAEGWAPVEQVLELVMPTKSKKGSRGVQ